MSSEIAVEVIAIRKHIKYLPSGKREKDNRLSQLESLFQTKIPHPI